MRGQIHDAISGQVTFYRVMDPCTVSFRRMRVSMWYLVRVYVVWNNLPQIEVCMIGAPLGEVMVQHVPVKREEQGAQQKDRC